MGIDVEIEFQVSFSFVSYFFFVILFFWWTFNNVQVETVHCFRFIVCWISFSFFFCDDKVTNMTNKQCYRDVYTNRCVVIAKKIDDIFFSFVLCIDVTSSSNAPEKWEKIVSFIVDCDVAIGVWWHKFVNALNTITMSVKKIESRKADWADWKMNRKKLYLEQKKKLIGMEAHCKSLIEIKKIDRWEFRLNYYKAWRI